MTHYYTRHGNATDDEILSLLYARGDELSLEAHNRIERMAFEPMPSDEEIAAAREEGEEEGRSEGADEKEDEVIGNFYGLKKDVEYLLAPLNGSYKALILNRLNHFEDSIYGKIYNEAAPILRRVSLASCYRATAGAWPVCGTGSRVGRYVLPGRQGRDAMALKAGRKGKTDARNQRACAWLKNRKR